LLEWTFITSSSERVGTERKIYEIQSTCNTFFGDPVIAGLFISCTANFIC
jgi:hypothetical protein